MRDVLNSGFGSAVIFYSWFCRDFADFQGINGPRRNCIRRVWTSRRCRRSYLEFVYSGRWYRHRLTVHREQNARTSIHFNFARVDDVFKYFDRLSLRLFDDQSGSSMWKRSVKDIQGEVLCVSQFTLLAKTTKGNKPDFHLAMVCCSLDLCVAWVCWGKICKKSSQQSEQMYGSLLSRLATLYYPDKIKGEKMDIQCLNRPFSCLIL